MVCIGMPLPVSSHSIATLEEAQAYYAAKLAGRQVVHTRGGTRCIINFEAATTHLFSEEVSREAFQLLPIEERVWRRLPGGRPEYRRFCLDRARLMDHVLPAIAGFVFSIPGTSAHGRGNRMLHGPALPDGRFLRVVLAPWAGAPKEWTCVSAYPLPREKWLEARRAKSAKFP